MPPWSGLLFLVALITGFAFRPRIRRWWRKGCDRCRLEDIGGNEWSHVAHTCFPWKNPYRDRKGRLYVFGRRVMEQDKESAR